jgi:hypothetical protein
MIYKRIISFGDSFTWGSELDDCLEHEPKEIIANPEKYQREYKIIQDRKIGPFSEVNLYGEYKSLKTGHSLNTWPALIAKHFNLDYYCQSQPGCSNQTIIRKITKFLSELTTNDLVIIDWTFQDRWDYYDTNDPYFENGWKTLTPTSTTHTKIEKFYFEQIQSETWNKWESLRAIMLACYMLQSKNIKFFMTCEDKLIFDTTYHFPLYVITAQNEIKDNIFWFDNKGFNSWASEKNFKRGQNNHPLEEAHQAAFEYIINNYEFT